MLHFSPATCCTFQPPFTQAGITQADADTVEHLCRFRKWSSVPDDPRARHMIVRGLIGQSPEHWLEASPVVLSLLQGGGRRIKHRIWRGQVALILPLLDDIRYRFNNTFSNYFEMEWPDRFLSYVPNEPKEPRPFGAELSLISACISGCREFERFAPHKQLVRHASEMRNKLAHYGIVSLDDYRTLRQLAVGFHDRGMGSCALFEVENLESSRS